MPKRLLPSLVILAILATMFGGAYLGYYSAEQKSAAEFTEPPSFEAPTNAQEAENTSSKPRLTPTTPPNATTAGPSTEEKLASAIEQRFGQPLDQLLPHGITEIEGRGGKGFRQQVKSHGTWYPIFDLSKASTSPTNDSTADSTEEEIDPDSVDLAEVALSIISSAPARSKVGESLQHQFTAVGGEPPYNWNMAPSPGPEFLLDPTTGLLSATPEREMRSTISITVTDSKGESASAVYDIIIQPEETLSIQTRVLEPATAGVTYSMQCDAKGGVTPYSWSLSPTDPDIELDSTTGLLQGTLSEPGEQILEIQVADAQGTSATATLRLSVTAGVDIITAAELPPVSPNSQFSQKLEATGGTLPYTWSLADGELPQGITLNQQHGILKGTAAANDAQYEFTIAVKDKLGTSYEKTFRFRVEAGFIAIPSRNCVGLAWRPERISASLQKQLRQVSITRDGSTIYSGTDTHWVDENVPYGNHVYTMTAQDQEGQTHPYSTAKIRILQATLARGAPGQTADPYADAVRLFSPLSAGGYGSTHLPLNVTGPPDAKSNPIQPANIVPISSPTELVSLHASTSGGGSIVLEFMDNIVRNGPGADFTVFENVFYVDGNPNNRFIEPAVVEVALWPGEWHLFPFAINQPASGSPSYNNPGYYALGFAGVNASTGENPTDPSRSGGDSFDLSHSRAPLKWFRYIRITATGHHSLKDLFNKPVGHTSVTGALSGAGSSGFDLDAVSAVNW